MAWQLILFVLALLVLFLINIYMHWKLKRIANQQDNVYLRLPISDTPLNESHHQDDIYNISGRVQGQEPQNFNQDAYLSVDHITTSNQLNKPNYEDAPPSYDEVMRIAVSQSSGSSEVPEVVVVPKTTD